MKINPFKLERYLAKYEFSAKYLLCSSDCDGLSQKELLSLADSETKNLWDKLKLGYTESAGHPLLRKEIAGLYQNISPEDVLVVAPAEGILITLYALLERGDHAICTFPGYQSLYEDAECLGCEVTKWQPEEENGWKFNPEFLLKNIKTNTKLLIINFPHNPTGYLPDKKDFEQIIEIAKKHNLYVFSDEMYYFLEYRSLDRLPAACEVYDKAISLFGVSKSFGLAGLRIGWLVTKNKNCYQNLALSKDYTTVCSSAPSEILALMVLKAKDKILADKLQVIQQNLLLLDSFFKKYNNQFTWIKPRAGTIAFPRINKDINSYVFCEKLIQKIGILLLPSSVYDYDNKHFRLGFGRKNMPEALEKFEEYIKNL